MTIYKKIIILSLLIVYPFYTNSVQASSQQQPIGEIPVQTELTQTKTPSIEANGVLDELFRSNDTTLPITKKSDLQPIGSVSVVTNLVKGIAHNSITNQLASIIMDKYNIHQKESRDIVHITYTISKDRKIPPLTMLAVIEVESSFNKLAKNKDAVGLTQTLSTIHRKKFGNRSFYDINANIDVGAQILSDCYQKYNKVEIKALRCYHGDTISSKPNKYVKEVMAKKQNFLVAINPV